MLTCRWFLWWPAGLVVVCYVEGKISAGYRLKSWQSLYLAYYPAGLLAACSVVGMISCLRCSLVCDFPEVCWLPAVILDKIWMLKVSLLQSVKLILAETCLLPCWNTSCVCLLLVFWYSTGLLIVGCDVSTMIALLSIEQCLLTNLRKLFLWFFKLFISARLLFISQALTYHPVNELLQHAWYWNAVT